MGGRILLAAAGSPALLRGTGLVSASLCAALAAAFFAWGLGIPALFLLVTAFGQNGSAADFHGPPFQPGYLHLGYPQNAGAVVLRRPWKKRGI